ncbi:hypothetical protein TNCV_2746691 [Trichonephila clavipes]|nr:hypothetical protein TNCV_2746691 [Trichonephila clavipes]
MPLKKIPWIATEYSQVVFSGESRFNLTVMTIVYVCGGSVVNALTLPSLYRDTPLPAGAIVWGTIAYDTQSPLILIHGTITGQWFVHDILQPHVLPLKEPFFNKTMLDHTQQDT